MPPNLELVRNWLRLARNDLKLAQLISSEPEFLENCCFHIQQCIEKALKAVLVANDQRPPRTHKLEDLFGLCERWMPGIVEFEQGCAWLSKWAVEIRYPNSPPPVTPRLVQDAAKTAQEVLDFISKRVPPEARPQ